MRKAISNRSKEHGIPLVQPKAGALRSDWIAIAAICVFCGSEDLAEFWALCVGLIHMASRGNEMGYLKHQHGRCVDCPTSSPGGLAAAYEVNNFKQGGTYQLMHIFPHATNWELDWFFAQAYHMCLSQTNSEYVFPHTSQAALKTNKEDKYDSSGVSKMWGDRFKSVLRKLEDAKAKLAAVTGAPSYLYHQFTPGLCSHSPRKFIITEMGRTLRAIYFIFRAGWTVQNVHTIFDYIVKDSHHDVEAAKTSAGWKNKWNDQVWGGYSNQLSDLATPEEREKFDEFTIILFFNQHTHMDRNLRHLHGFSVLRFYQDFEQFLKDAQVQPGSQIFVQLVEHALQQAKVSRDMFDSWQQEIRTKFKQRNWYGMSLHDVPEFEIDSKPLIEDMAKLKSATLHISQGLHNVDDDVAKLNKNLEQLDRKVALVLDRQEQNSILLQRLLDGLANRGIPINIGEPPSLAAQVPTTAQPTAVAAAVAAFTPVELEGAQEVVPVPWPGQQTRNTNIEFDVVFKNRYKGSVSCVIIFKAWFQNQLAVAFYNMEKGAQIKSRNSFSSCKKVVDMMLKSLEKYPDQDDDLDVLAKEAMSSIMASNELGKEPTRSRMVTNSKQHGICLYDKGNYIERPFPPDTPDTVVQFFNARGNNPAGAKKRKHDLMEADIE